MLIYLFLGILIYLGFIIIGLYIYRLQNIKCKYYLVLETQDCGDLCEGIIRWIYSKFSNINNYCLYVIDRGSKDDTLPILKRLARRYFFKLIINTGMEVEEILQVQDYFHVILKKDTPYKEVIEELTKIRQLITINANIH